MTTETPQVRKFSIFKKNQFSLQTLTFSLQNLKCSAQNLVFRTKIVLFSTPGNFFKSRQPWASTMELHAQLRKITGWKQKNTKFCHKFTEINQFLENLSSKSFLYVFVIKVPPTFSARPQFNKSTARPAAALLSLDKNYWRTTFSVNFWKIFFQNHQNFVNFNHFLKM